VSAFTGTVVVAVTLPIGLLPSLRIASAGMGACLSQAARESSGSRSTLRRAIAVGLLHLPNADAGVRVANVIATRLELPYSAGKIVHIAGGCCANTVAELTDVEVIGAGPRRVP